MDSFSAFESGDGHESAGEAIDVFSSARLDDRRVQVRLYRHWISRLRGRPCPSIADMEPGSLEGSHGLLLDLRGGNDNPAVTKLGEALREIGGGIDVKSVRDIPADSLLARLTGHYPAVLGTGEPVAFEGEQAGSHGERILYRAILLPLSDGAGRIDFIAGVMNWREFADSGITAGIAFEVGRSFSEFEDRRMQPAGDGIPFPGFTMQASPQPELPLSV